jgi:CelD/BcsL family acetyltransferase involved in cellulose biosynthesis
LTLTAVDPRTETLRLETFTSFDAAHAVAAEWDALIARTDGSLYMTPAWCEVWWRHFGAGRELRVIAVRDGEELVAVLPFFVERLLGPLGRTRVAKLVGSDSSLALVELPALPGTATEALALGLRALVAEVDMVHVGPCPGALAQLDALRAAAAEIADVADVARDREAGSHTVFELPHGFDAYLQTLSKNQRGNYRRSVNKLAKAFEFEVDILRDRATLEREFEAFVDMHQAQWQAVDKLGHFDDWPRGREYGRDLVATFAERDEVRMIRLIADGQVVAYYWCFAHGGTYYWRLPARLTDSSWDQFSLGRVGLMKMMEVAAGEGATSIEAGTGRYEYKEKLNAKTLPLASVTLARRGLLPALRARSTCALGDLLQLVYYRIWFQKVGPRLGLLRGPLARSWIRRRF